MSLKEELEELNTRVVIGSTFDVLHESVNDLIEYSD